MKRFVKITLWLLAVSCILPHIHRAFNSVAGDIIHPFYFDKEVEISIGWYVKDIGDLLSYSLQMLMICYILIPVKKHFEEVLEDGKSFSKLLIFVTMWLRLFQTIFVTSVFDFLHYMIAFKHIQIYFLTLNGVYFLFSIYIIRKLWKQ